MIGAEAHGSYKLGKFKKEFKRKPSKIGYKFDDWDAWFDLVEKDGFLCRTNNDCNWLDPKLYCQAGISETCWLGCETNHRTFWEIKMAKKYPVDFEAAARTPSFRALKRAPT